jgi:hypothetical protein
MAGCHGMLSGWDELMLEGWESCHTPKPQILGRAEVAGDGVQVQLLLRPISVQDQPCCWHSTV